MRPEKRGAWRDAQRPPGAPVFGLLNLIHRNNSPESIAMRVSRPFGGTKCSQ